MVPCSLQVLYYRGRTRQDSSVETYTFDGSRTVAKIRYRPDRTLDIELRNGAVYRYFVVPRRIVEGFLGAESPGAFFNSEVRGNFGETVVSARTR